MEHNKKSGIGAFLSGALVATAVTGYMLFGSKNAKKNRDKVEGWVDDAKADVTDKIKKIKKLSKEKYNEVVDTVSDKYAQMKEVGKEKADKLREELKNKWDQAEREARKEMDDE